jgi:formylglycine-generating enzyme required for sulfatase activity/predicted Ser/Thr protein kinase
MTTSTSEISRMLDGARAGTVSKEQLLAAIDRQLRQGTVNPDALLSALADERIRAGLPVELQLEAVRKVRSWLAVPQPPATRGWKEDGVDTVVNPEAVQKLLADGYGAVELGPPQAAPPGLHADTATMVGRVLNQRFQLVERVGAGGMSSVFKAIDRRRTESRSPDPYVAVKMLNLSFRDSAAALTLLQREAQKLQILAHPNIVRVMDCDRDGSLVFMTMEYLTGDSLKHKMHSSITGLQQTEAIPILDGIANALMFAHRNGIVHGDLKPANVIITSAGQTKVIDFGVARMISQSHYLQSAPRIHGSERNIALTPAYASPEMLANQPADPRDDIYALGCLVSEMFGGTHPFDRKSAAEARTAGMAPIRGPGLTRRHFKAICGALQFDREQRTPTVERFVHEFSGGADRSGWRYAGFAAVLGVLLLIGAVVTFERSPSLISGQRVSDTLQQASLVPNAVFRDCPTCPLMRVLPPGRFEQGSDPGAADATALEYPRHPVQIAYPLGIGVYDVSVAEFKEFAEVTGREPQGCWAYDGAWRERPDLNWRNVGYEQSASHPATCVSWQDAVAYADWLSVRTGQRYRLPSASEWEYAAGAGGSDARPWGTQPELACKSANVADQTAAAQFPGWKVLPCRDGYVYTAPVGSFAPNAFGLYDTLGNVFQWVQDCWHDDYDHAPQNGAAWTDGDCTRREVRGGSWFTDPAYVRTTYRNHFGVDYRTNTVGFRVARVLR